MSAFIPAQKVNREYFMQLKRREVGLKTGEYVKWPDAIRGPQVIRAYKVAIYNEKYAEYAEKTLAVFKAQDEAKLKSTSEGTKNLEALASPSAALGVSLESLTAVQMPNTPVTTSNKEEK